MSNATASIRGEAQVKRDGEELRRALELLGVDAASLPDGALDDDAAWLDALAKSPLVRWFDWRTSPEAALDDLCRWVSKREYVDYEEKVDRLVVWREHDSERVGAVVVEPWPTEHLDPVVVAFCTVLGDGTSAVRIAALEGSDSYGYAMVSASVLRSLREVLGAKYATLFTTVATGGRQDAPEHDVSKA